MLHTGQARRMSVERLSKDGVECFVITNGGVKLSCISLGATVTSLKLQDGIDVVLGYDNNSDYAQTNSKYIGSSVGRVANRIREATFTLNGTKHTVSANCPPHTLHGGEIGFDKANWLVSNVTENAVSFQHTSKAGDMGYPGTLTATATYTINQTGEVLVEYTATTDQPTIVNIVNHTYFNLAQKGTIHDHLLKLNATTYTPLDDELISKGTLEPVMGTPLDFTVPTALGIRMAEVGGGGYDMNYNVKDSTEYHPQYSNLHLCATLSEPSIGHELKVYSDQPGIQLYTGNFLDGSYREKDGSAPIIEHAGVCLETQAWPNAINTPGEEYQMTLQAGGIYCNTTLWKFK